MCCSNAVRSPYCTFFSVLLSCNLIALATWKLECGRQASAGVTRVSRPVRHPASIDTTVATKNGPTANSLAQVDEDVREGAQAAVNLGESAVCSKPRARARSTRQTGSLSAWRAAKARGSIGIVGAAGACSAPKVTHQPCTAWARSPDSTARRLGALPAHNSSKQTDSGR